MTWKVNEDKFFGYTPTKLAHTKRTTVDGQLLARCGYKLRINAIDGTTFFAGSRVPSGYSNCGRCKRVKG
jgi:hypothetical protein